MNIQAKVDRIVESSKSLEVKLHQIQVLEQEHQVKIKNRVVSSGISEKLVIEDISPLIKINEG